MVSGLLKWLIWAAIIFGVGYLIWFKLVPTVKAKVA